MTLGGGCGECLPLLRASIGYGRGRGDTKGGPGGRQANIPKILQVWVGAEILLFVLVGASVDMGYATSAGLKTLLMITAVLAMRAVGILLCLIKTDLNWKERLFCALTGIPKATVQAAIGGIPLAMGLPNGSIFLAVAVFSTLFTAPLGALVLDKTYTRLLTWSEADR